MNYKKSNYNVEIETIEEGKKLVYNTYSGIFGIMDVKTQEIYNNIEKINNINAEEIETAKTIDIMAKAGYIIDRDKDELATMEVERAVGRFNKNHMHLAIAPTMDCNMCCPYCFENKNKLVMDDKTQEALIDFTKLHFEAHKNIKSLSVGWYGGEPLLQKDVIYSISEKLIDLCEEKEVSYSATITTNGILLDIDTTKRLVNDCKISSAQITIDGMKETHNKRRLLVGDGDSFDIIVQNIDACKDFINITVRVNVDKDNMDDVEKLTEFFLEEKQWSSNPSFYLAPVDNHYEACLNENTRCLQGEEFAEIDIKCVREIYKRNRDSVARSFFPKRRPVFCGGESVFNYVVDPEGFTYNCYAQVGEKNQSTGHIYRPFAITPKYGKWLLSDIHDKCKKCYFLPMCMGGCMIHRLNSEGTPQCFRTFYNYKETLKLAYEDYKSFVSIENKINIL